MRIRHDVPLSEVLGLLDTRLRLVAVLKKHVYAHKRELCIVLGRYERKLNELALERRVLEHMRLVLARLRHVDYATGDSPDLHLIEHYTGNKVA